MASTKIGIIGNGNVGAALERGWSKAGYEVRATGNDPTRVKEIGGWADIVVLAVPFPARQDAVRTLGEAIDGKPLVDVTNALGEGMSYQGSVRESGAEELADLAPEAHVVKAFNTVFAQYMDKGSIGNEPLSLFVASDDEDARRRVMDLGEAIGFDPIDAGPLETARYLEALGYLNMTLAFKANHGPNVGFKFIHERPARGTRPTAASGRHEREAETSKATKAMHK